MPIVNLWHIQQAKRALQQGGIIACPTESVFGLSCLPSKKTAVFRILELKKRPWQKGVIVVAASCEQLQVFIECGDDTLSKIKQSWPGPVTWLVFADRRVPMWIRGMHSEIAVRVSAHPVVQALCQQVGPIISTSANITGKLPARSSCKVRQYFRTKIDYIFPGQASEHAAPTEIRCAASSKIIRTA